MRLPLSQSTTKMSVSSSDVILYRTIVAVTHNLVSLSWDLKNPQEISLPSHNPEVQNDVRCIAAVRDRVWVGAGPSMFFLSAESLDCEVHEMCTHIRSSNAN